MEENLVVVIGPGAVRERGAAPVERILDIAA
jgi:hypothetical protein